MWECASDPLPYNREAMASLPAPARALRTETVRIPSRFNGPPTSGHGGYCAGVVALPLPGAVAVDLRRPIPLERELRRALLDDGRVTLHDGETLIAEARGTTLDLEVPAAPDWEESMDAAGRYPGFQAHSFDTCFGCGTRRAEGDGLRIFSGPRASGKGMAAPWVPDPSIAREDGVVPPEMVWAALDCPSGWPAVGVVRKAFPGGSQVFTAQLAARIDGVVRAGERYVTLGWHVRADGRKLYTGTALYDEDGTPVAVGTALWIVVVPKD